MSPSRTSRLLLLPALALVAACGGQDPSARAGGHTRGGNANALAGGQTAQELHESIEQPALSRAQSGRLPA